MRLSFLPFLPPSSLTLFFVFISRLISHVSLLLFACSHFATISHLFPPFLSPCSVLCCLVTALLSPLSPAAISLSFLLLLLNLSKLQLPLCSADLSAHTQHLFFILCPSLPAVLLLNQLPSISFSCLFVSLVFLVMVIFGS